MSNIHGKTPYAGIKPLSGKRPVLVILLEPYRGDDARFNTVYGTDSAGRVLEMVLSVDRRDGSIKIADKTGIVAAPFSAAYPPAVTRSPHPHLLTLLFATGSDGRVYQTFYDRHSGHSRINHPWQTWQALPGGIQSSSAPAALNSPKGDLALAFVTASDRQVYQSVFARGQGQAWTPWKSLHFPQVSSGPAAMNSADGDRLSVFATGTTGHVYESTYFRGAGSHWAQKLLPQGPMFRDTPACVASIDGTLESVFAIGTDGRVYQAMRAPLGNWSSWKAVPGSPGLQCGLSVLDSENRKFLSIIGVDSAGRLQRCRFVREGVNQWSAWEPVTTGVLGAVNWTGACQMTTPATAASVQTYREAFFGAGNSLRNYFWENSDGQFTIEEASVVGWIRPGPALGMPPHVDIDSYDFVHNSNETFGISDEEKSNWVIKAAEVIGGFNYATLDTSGSGTVTLDDAAIVWIYAGGDSGRVRGVSPSLVKVPSLSGGVTQSYGLPRAGPDPAIRTSAEELAHAIVGVADLYDPSGTLPPVDTEPRALAVTGIGGDAPHLSPFDKMKAGWAKVRYADADATYSLPAVETTNEILILRDTTVPDEYFILENRHPPGSFESSFPGMGLAVWHIVERFDNASDGNWGRNTIRLLHCQPATSTTIGETFLWNGAIANQSYDLTDTSAPANLNWSNGSFSGFAIRGVSAAGPTMSFRVAVP